MCIINAFAINVHVTINMKQRISLSTVALTMQMAIKIIPGLLGDKYRYIGTENSPLIRKNPRARVSGSSGICYGRKALEDMQQEQQ